MYSKKLKLIFLILLIIIFYLTSFTFNDYLSLTMQRHQLIQLHLMIVIGILLNVLVLPYKIKDVFWGISAIIIIVSSLIFWMIPVSIDYAVIYEWVNRLMHIDMVIIGYLIVALLRGEIFELKIYLLGMATAMSFAVGLSLQSISILLCSSFDIYQQRETGFYLTLISIALFCYTIFTFFYLGNKK